MSDVAQFNGFTKQSTQFLADLKQHNDRVWFNRNKGEFEDYLMTPAREFVTAMGEKLRAIAPNIQADPRVDRSIFRIYRDTRFSKDKSPYKTHLAFWFWEGSKSRMENPGFYFHLEPDHLMLGTGIYTFTKETLKVYRSSVVDDTHGGQLEQAIAKVTSNQEYSLGGKHYKRVPRGYDQEHKRAELLKYNGLYCGIESPIPEEFYSVILIDYCYSKYTIMLPIHRWLLGLNERT